MPLLRPNKSFSLHSGFQALIAIAPEALTWFQDLCNLLLLPLEQVALPDSNYYNDFYTCSTALRERVFANGSNFNPVPVLTKT